MDRVIDLDLLIYGNHRVEKETLTVPHPGLLERPFALIPAQEIGGDLFLPGHALRLNDCLVDRHWSVSLWGCL
jgi:2-amino-4-hydroxy-6-hydroxymethyldihydropteridine diphosphokinase